MLHLEHLSSMLVKTLLRTIVWYSSSSLFDHKTVSVLSLHFWHIFELIIIREMWWSCCLSDACFPVLPVCSVRQRGAGSTWPPRRSSLYITTRSWRTGAGWGAGAARRTPGTEAAHCCWTDLSLPHTQLQFVPSVCVFCLPMLDFQVRRLLIFEVRGPSLGPFRSSSWPRALKTDLVLFVCSVSLRVFSLNVPLASKTLVILIYKPSAGITVSLELKTTDASLCTHINARDVNREFLTIHPLLIPAHPLQRCCGGLEPIPAWVLLLLLHVR